MPTPYDVPPDLLIRVTSQYLKKNVDEVTPPDWATIVKTGPHAERPPEDPEWWYTRCASILRKLYLKGPIGVERLRSEYGGRQDRGAMKERAVKGSGAIVRLALKQLEAAGLVDRVGNRGRVVSREGRRLLDRLSTQIKEELEKKNPELRKY